MIDTIRPGEAKQGAPVPEHRFTQAETPAPNQAEPVQARQPQHPREPAAAAAEPRPPVKSPARPPPAPQPAPESWEWPEQGQTPLMVGPEPERGRWRVRILFLVLLLVGGATAAYFSFDSVRELIGLSEKAQPTAVVNAGPGTGIRPGPAATNPPAPAPAATQSATPSGAAQHPPEKSPVVEPAQHNAPVGSQPAGQGAFSLQAASFPSEQDARRFAEKLTRTGVPAYVIRADIPRRGRWYRVRAGRFGSPAETQKYAADWRQRARASGISVQFVQCSYDQP